MLSFKLINKGRFGQLVGEENTISLIREHFSIPNPSYRRNSYKFTPSRLYAITPQGKFKIGLHQEIESFCKTNFISYTKEIEFLSKIENGLENPLVEQLDREYRPYQKQSIELSLKKGHGVIVIPTAGGKTLIMAGLIKSYLKSNLNFKKILVIVPSLQLVHQTSADFITYGLKDISKWCGDFSYDPRSKIVIAGSQILMSSKTDLSVLDDVDLLLVDEVHQTKRGNRINEVLKFVKTSFRFGFTGTLPSSNIDVWNIIGEFGPILYEEKTFKLKQQSFVSEFKIVLLKIEHKNLPSFNSDNSQPTAAYLAEMDYLMRCERRNEIITSLSLKLTENTLIMVDRIDHGVILKNFLDRMNEQDRPVYFIQGETEITVREEIRKLMDERRDVIVIAISKIFSTGINIPNLHNIIFASIGKAKIKIMQSIGRVLRLHHTKSVATIFDIADNTRYGKKHVEERKKLYKLENYEYIEKKIT